MPPAQPPPARRTRGRRHPSVRDLAVAVVAVAAASALAFLGTGGTAARWSDARVLEAGVVRSGTADLRIEGALSPAAFGHLLPGEAVAQQVTLVGAGTTALTVTASVAAESTGFEVRVALDHPGCGAAPLAGAGVTALHPAPAPLGTIGAGSSLPLCVEVTALAAAVPTQAASFTVTLHGTQER